MKKDINFLLESSLGLTRNTLKLKINNDWIDVGSEVKNKLQKIMDKANFTRRKALRNIMQAPIGTANEIL